MDLSESAGDEYCYLTTIGRTSGEPREIEIWFGLIGTTLFMLSGSGTAAHGAPKAHWVRNLLKTPEVVVRIGERSFQGGARVCERGTPEDEQARPLLVRKYQAGSSGDLTKWGETAIVVAVDLRDD